MRLSPLLAVRKRLTLLEREGPQVCSSGVAAANWPCAGSGKAAALAVAEASKDPAKRASGSLSKSVTSSRLTGSGFLAGGAPSFERVAHVGGPDRFVRAIYT